MFERFAATRQGALTLPLAGNVRDQAYRVNGGEAALLVLPAGPTAVTVAM